MDPEGTFKKIWDLIIVLILLYTATFAPYNTAFVKDVDISELTKLIEVSIDGLFISDIFMTFLTPF